MAALQNGDDGSRLNNAAMSPFVGGQDGPFQNAVWNGGSSPVALMALNTSPDMLSNGGAQFGSSVNATALGSNPSSGYGPNFNRPDIYGNTPNFGVDLNGLAQPAPALSPIYSGGPAPAGNQPDGSLYQPFPPAGSNPQGQIVRGLLSTPPISGAGNGGSYPDFSFGGQGDLGAPAPSTQSSGWSLFGYPSAQAAAQAALNYYNPISIADNTERTGVIIGLPYLGYTYLAPTLNGPAGDTNPPACVGCSAYYHTYAANDVRYDNENFSTWDRGLAQAPAGNVSGPVPIYLGTPSGAMKVYNPITGYEGPIK